MKPFGVVCVFLSLLISQSSCNKSGEEPSGPCSGSKVVTWPKKSPTGRFNLSDSTYYLMTYELVDTTAVVTFTGYFNNACAKPQMQMVILIQGNWTTISGKVYLSYCSGLPEEEIDVPAVWSGHWYDRKATINRVLSNCSTSPSSNIKIRLVYTFHTTGSRSNDLLYMAYTSEFLLFTATFSD